MDALLQRTEDINGADDLTLECVDDIVDAANTIRRLDRELEEARKKLKSCFVEETIMKGEELILRRTPVGWKKRAEAMERELRGVCWCCANLGTQDCKYNKYNDQSGETELMANPGCKDWRWKEPEEKNGGGR